MKQFLQNLLGVQTLKILLFNPAAIEFSSLKALDVFPVIYIPCFRVDDIKIIDTGIPVKKKKV